MRLWRTRVVLALLLAPAALALPGFAHAGTQWSGIKGRAVLESFIITQSFTNIVPGLPPIIPVSSYVAVRSPIKTTIRVYAAKSGRLVRTVDTDDSGRFVVRLQPGL